jgi:hypothetical protein
MRRVLPERGVAGLGGCGHQPALGAPALSGFSGCPSQRSSDCVRVAQKASKWSTGLTGSAARGWGRVSRGRAFVLAAPPLRPRGLQHPPLLP